METWKKSVMSRASSKCKSPEAAVFPEHLRGKKEAGTAVAQ